MDKIKAFLNNLGSGISNLVPDFSTGIIGATQAQRKAQAELDAQMQLAQQMRLRDETEKMAYQKYGSPYMPDWSMNNNADIEELIRQNQAAMDRYGGGGGIGGGAGLADPNAYLTNVFNDLKKSLQPALDMYGQADARAKEFEDKNPYSFDEAQARASAEERFNPYYKAELGDYLTGIERVRQRGTQDDEQLRKEISVDTEQYVGRSRRELDKAIEASGEGAAGAGIFFSGQRVRREGEMKVDTAERIGDFNLQNQRTMENSATGLQRLVQDQDAQSRTFQRKLGAEKETNLLTDIAKQQGEYNRNREVQRQQYIGFPYATGSSTLKSLLGV